MRAPSSIRARLAAVSGLVVLGAGSLLAVGGHARLSRELLLADEEFARHEAIEVANGISHHGSAEEVRRHLRENRQAYLPEPGVEGLAVFGLDRALVYAFEDGAVPDLPGPRELSAVRLGELPVWAPDPSRQDLQAALFATYDREPRWLVVSRVNRERSLAALSRLRVGALAVVPLAAGLTAVLAFALASLALAPVGRLVADVRAIAVEGLGRRLDVPRESSELAELARLLNQTLEESHQVAARTQRFAADASHELRTPLARMLGEAEVALRDGASTTQRAALESIVAELDHLRRLVDGLLLLARGGTRGQPGEPFDLVALVDASAAEARLLGEGPGVEVRWARPGASLLVRGPRELIGRAIWNLLANALAWTPRGGRIELVLETQPPYRLTVRDTGPGVDAADRERIFEPFFRGAGAAPGEGLGIGLALARTIARRYGGDLRLADEAPGATFVLELPPA